MEYNIYCTVFDVYVLLETFKGTELVSSEEICIAEFDPVRDIDEPMDYLNK